MARDVATEVTDSGELTEMQGGGKLAETLRIDHYIYKGSAPLSAEEQDSDALNASWGGLAVVATDTSEYATVAAFDAYLASGMPTVAWDNAAKTAAISWTLGGDTLACTFNPTAKVQQPTTNTFPSRTLNGEWLYLPPGVERECDLSAMSSNGLITKNGATFEGAAGRMGAIMTDPVRGIYEAWNPFPNPTPFKFAVPGGGVIAFDDPVGITRVTVYTQDSRIDIDGALPAAGDTHTARVTGFPANVKVFHNGKGVAPKPDGALTLVR